MIEVILAAVVGVIILIVALTLNQDHRYTNELEERMRVIHALASNGPKAGNKDQMFSLIRAQCEHAHLSSSAAKETKRAKASA